MSIQSSSKLTTTGARIPRAQIEQLLAIAGPDATFTFHQDTPDRPGETTTSSVTATWTNTPADPTPAEIPTGKELEQAIEVLATDLWEADTAKDTPARTFGEDYANRQDRYRTMARAILAPEPTEPAKK